MLLVVTCEDDIHTDAVILSLRHRYPEFPVVRINTDQFSTNAFYRFWWNPDGSFNSRGIKLHDSKLEVQKPSVIWYRKPDIPSAHPSISDPIALECCRQEWREFLHAFQGFFPEARWVNDYWTMQRCAIKPYQIQHAQNVGLAVPETLITNNYELLKEFVLQFKDVIVKPLYYAGYEKNGEHFVCYTSLISPDDLQNISAEQLKYAPVFLQRRIPKFQELRITVIGKQIVACEITTDPKSPENVDWRINDPEMLPHRIVELPKHIKDSIGCMVANMGLNYGALDVIRDNDGEFYFLEINPNGQYYWIEILTGAKLSDAMADLIVNLSGISGVK